MSDVVRAELFKLGKRPAAWVLLAAAAVLSQVFGYLVPYLSYRPVTPTSFAGGALAAGAAGQHAARPARRQHARRVPGVRRCARAGARRADVRRRVRLGHGQDDADPAARPRARCWAGSWSRSASRCVVGVAVLFARSAPRPAAGIALAEDQPLDWPGLAALAGGSAPAG